MDRVRMPLALGVVLGLAGTAAAQPERDPLQDIRVTVGAVTVGELPAERDDRWNVHAQVGADARGGAGGATAGGELALGGALHRGTAECLRSIDLSGQARLGVGQVPVTQYTARAEGCLAGWHILRSLDFAADGGLLPPLSLGRGLRSLPLTRTAVGFGFAMVSIAMREASFEVMAGHAEVATVAQSAPGQPATRTRSMDLDIDTFSFVDAASGGRVDFLSVGIRESDLGTADSAGGPMALSMSALRVQGAPLRAGFRLDADLSLQAGNLPLPDDGGSAHYLTLTTAGAVLGLERPAGAGRARVRYQRGLVPSPGELALEDRLDASLSLPRAGTTAGLRGFAAWTQVWTGPGGPAERAVTGGAAVDWTRALRRGAHLGVTAEVARSYYADPGAGDPRPATAARLLAVVSADLAGDAR